MKHFTRVTATLVFDSDEFKGSKDNDQQVKDFELRILRLLNKLDCEYTTETYLKDAE